MSHRVPGDAAPALPDRIVVGANGAYWRYFEPDGVGMTEPFYSMCPVSSDNDPVEPIAVYVPEAEIERLREGIYEAAELLGEAVRRPLWGSLQGDWVARANAWNVKHDVAALVSTHKGAAGMESGGDPE